MLLRRTWPLIRIGSLRAGRVHDGQLRIRELKRAISPSVFIDRTPLVPNSVFPIRQIEPNQSKSRRAWSGSSMILWFVMLGMKRVRLAKSDDQDSLFRISRWVTPANRNESGGKKPNLTRRRGEGRGGKQQGIHHIVTNLPTAFSASPREQNSGWSPVLWDEKGPVS